MSGEPARASESDTDPTDDERAVTDVDPVLVAVAVAVSLEIEPIEGVPARHLEPHMPKVEPDTPREALLVVEEPILLVLTAGSEIPVVVSIEPRIDP